MLRCYVHIFRYSGESHLAIVSVCMADIPVAIYPIFNSDREERILQKQLSSSGWIKCQKDEVFLNKLTYPDHKILHDWNGEHNCSITRKMKQYSKSNKIGQ